MPGDESEPALPADGRRVAFVWTGPEKTSSRIFVLNAGSVQPFALTSGAGRDASPAWSPDDRQIAFVREQQGHGGSREWKSPGYVSFVLDGERNTLQAVLTPDGKQLSSFSATAPRGKKPTEREGSCRPTYRSTARF